MFNVIFNLTAISPFLSHSLSLSISCYKTCRKIRSVVNYTLLDQTYMVYKMFYGPDKSPFYLMPVVFPEMRACHQKHPFIPSYIHFKLLRIETTCLTHPTITPSLQVSELYRPRCLPFIKLNQSLACI